LKLTVLALLGLALEEGAGEGQRGVALDDVHLELGLAPHLAQLWLVGIRVDLRLLFAVHRVVYIEADHHLLLVRLLGELHIGAGQFHGEAVQGAGHRLALLHLALGHDLLGEELHQFLLTCRINKGLHFQCFGQHFVTPTFEVM